MKKFLQFSLLALAFLTLANTSFAQKKIKTGVVKFELDMGDGGGSPEMAMLGGMTLDFYFSETMQRMDMSMLGGMMRIQTIVPNDKPEDGALLMDMLGQKIQVIEVSEDDLANSNGFMNMDNVESVVYDKKDKKEIAGYDCYLATVTLKDGGKTMKYYITEKIKPPLGMKQKGAEVLSGFPLEMIIDTGEGVEMVFTAKEVLDKLSDTDFVIGEGYTKMTMEEFEKAMGEMDLGF